MKIGLPLVLAAVVGGVGASLSQHGQTLGAVICWMGCATLTFIAGVALGVSEQSQGKP